jgi:tripeptidyl-peptidase-1
MKLGLQGTSIFIASGDSGVAGRPGQENECLGPNAKVFSPDFPANCPWVTGGMSR